MAEVLQKMAFDQITSRQKNSESFIDIHLNHKLLSIVESERISKIEQRFDQLSKLKVFHLIYIYFFIIQQFYQQMGSVCCTVESKKCFSQFDNQKQSTVLMKFKGMNQKFNFGKLIGKGSVSTVRVIESNQTQRLFALKIFSKLQIYKTNSVRSVLREKEMLVQLKNQGKTHPFLIDIHQSVQDRQNLYLILEHMPMGTLRSLLKYKKHLDESKLKFLAACLLLALDYLNSNSILHGDIKPENIMIDGHANFRLGDFSSAVNFSDETKQIKGTKGYMAPEIQPSQFKGEKKIQDNRSDIYSLGLVLWECAYGYPYDRSDETDSKRNRSSISLTSDDEEQSEETVFSPQFLNFLMGMLKKEPKERMSVEACLNHSWIGMDQKARRQFLDGRHRVNPFSGIEDYFDYVSRRPSVNLESVQEDEGLTSSIILNDSKFQSQFLGFEYSARRHLVSKYHQVREYK